MGVEPVKKADALRPIQLTLFITPNSVASSAAVLNVRRALGEHSPRAFSLEVIDVIRDPQRFLRESIFVTPTLVATDRARRVVGELSDGSLLGYFLQSLLHPSEPTDERSGKL